MRHGRSQEFNSMSKKQCTAITLAILSLLGTEIAYCEPLAALFGGKSAQEQEQLLKQKDQECRVRLDAKDQQYQRLLDGKKDESDAAQSLREKNSTLMEAYEKLKTDQ